MVRCVLGRSIGSMIRISVVSAMAPSAASTAATRTLLMAVRIQGQWKMDSDAVAMEIRVEAYVEGSVLNGARW